MTTHGLRRVSAASISAQQASRIYPDVSRITRAEALKTAKRVAAVLGLKASKIALIDQLFAFSQPQDWRGASRPIIWPTNKLLARRLGVTISTLKYHLHGLVQAGLIAYFDGPTFQRKGRRDEAGNIVEGNGIDLSPVAVRYAEFAERVAAAEREAQDRQQASYRRTVLRREIEAVIADAMRQDLAGPWQQFRARLDRLCAIRATSLEALQEQNGAYEALRDDAEEAYNDASQRAILDTAVAKFRPQQTTADGQNSVDCIRRREPEGSPHSCAVTFGDVRSADDKSGVARSEPQVSAPGSRSDPSDDIKNISLPLVKDACPHAADFIPDAFASWAAFRSHVDTMCRITSINPQVLEEARMFLGADLAAVAVALTLQKSSVGSVAKPGAYLRSLVQRGRAGELHLSRSLFALLNVRSRPAAGVKGDRTAYIACEF